MIHLLTLY
uniref:Uncharacterized protein n=1 Tax=Anguilla anguilla TaxID=7936 RepID=A0A0E9U7V7_ANGAN